MKHTQTHTYTHAPNSPTAKQQKKLLTPKPFTANIQEPQVLSIKLLFCCHFHILFSYFLLFGFFHFVALAEIYFEVIFFLITHTNTTCTIYTNKKRNTHKNTNWTKWKPTPDKGEYISTYIDLYIFCFLIH